MGTLEPHSQGRETGSIFCAVDLQSRDRGGYASTQPSGRQVNYGELPLKGLNMQQLANISLRLRHTTLCKSARQNELECT